jgi:hypothetical protein
MKLSLVTRYTAYFFLFRIAAARGIKSKGEKGSEAVALISRLSLHRKAKREREREREKERERRRKGEPPSRYSVLNLNFKAIVGRVAGKSHFDRHRLMIDTLIGDPAEP